jgi:hypothetical protein
MEVSALEVAPFAGRRVVNDLPDAAAELGLAIAGAYVGWRALREDLGRSRSCFFCNYALPRPELRDRTDFAAENGATAA